MIYFFTFFCAAFLAGAALFVQIIHYPLMREVGKKIMLYMYEHQMKTLYVIGPVMAIEALTAIWFLVQFPSWFSFISALLVAGVWASTMGLQIPQHRILMTGFNHKALEKLIYTNWIRVGLWSSRSLLLIVFGILKYSFGLIR